MLVRVLQFIVGAALSGGGGYLAWTARESAANLFPPPAEGLPFLLLAGLFGLTSGIVFLVSAVHPRPNQRRALAERTAREAAALGEAEAYYGGRSQAADRDWRSGDITPLAPPPPEPQPAAGVPPISVESAPRLEVAETEALARPRSLSMPPAAAAPAAKAVASAGPAGNGAVATPFPSTATLSPLPRAAESPPALAPRAAPPAPPATPAANDPHAAIRAAIGAGRLDEADKMLVAARDSATGLDLALLTALAGDHAAVSGRQSHAKWLWRLALKRFGELGALDSPAARAVAENLQRAG